MSNAPIRKRKRVNANKRWNEAEEYMLLNYLLDLVPKNKEFEKPNKAEFYQNMTKELHLAVSDWSQTMNKVKNMRTSYVKAVDWKADTGQGVESGTIEGHVKQICPYFDTLEEIFGHKMNVVPPFIYESGLVVDQQVQHSQLENNEDDETFYGNAEFVNCRQIESEYSIDSDDVNGCDTLGNDNSEATLLNEENNISNDDLEIPRTPLTEMSRFKTILGTAPANPTSTDSPPSMSNSKSSQKAETENISGFKNRLLKSPVSEKNKTMSRNLSSILADAQNKKAEAILGRNEIERIRAENENLYKLEEVSLAKEKFFLEKETRKTDLELRKMDIDLRAQEIESRERIEKYRIEMEARTNFEIAKLPQQNM